MFIAALADRQVPGAQSEREAREAATRDYVLVEAVMVTGQAIDAIVAGSLMRAAQNLTFPQLRALLALCEDKRRLSDLAACLNVSASSTTRMVDRLVNKRLATRERDPVDRREVAIEISAQGRHVVADVMATWRAEVHSALEQMSSGELVELVSSLHVLTSAAAGKLHGGPGARVDHRPGIIPSDTVHSFFRDPQEQPVG